MGHYGRKQWRADSCRSFCHRRRCSFCTRTDVHGSWYQQDNKVPKAPVHHEAAEEEQDENAKDTHIAERLKKLLAEDEEAGSNGADSGKVEIKILNKK